MTAEIKPVSPAWHLYALRRKRTLLEAEQRAVESAASAPPYAGPNPTAPTASLPSDGEVDEIRKRHETAENEGWGNPPKGREHLTDPRRRMLAHLCLAHEDRATLLARLTALEAENAALEARIREPLTDEGWMRACLDAREERNALKAEVAGLRTAIRDTVEQLESYFEDGAPVDSKQWIADLRAALPSQGEQGR